MRGSKTCSGGGPGDGWRFRNGEASRLGERKIAGWIRNEGTSAARSEAESIANWRFWLNGTAPFPNDSLGQFDSMVVLPPLGLPKALRC